MTRTKIARLISVIATMLTLTALDLATLFILGEIVNSQTYPVMSVVKYIEVADFLEHLESIIMAIWVGGAFIKISVYYYVLILGTAQWMKLSDYRPIVLPIGILVVSFSFWSGKNVADLSHFLQTTGLLFNIIAQLAIPMLLLLISYIRKN